MSNIKKGDHITIRREVTGEVTHIGRGNYIEVTSDEDGSVTAHRLDAHGVTYEVHTRALSALEQFEALEPGAKFRLEGSNYYGRDSVRVKINDKMYYNTNTEKTIKVGLSNILHDTTIKVVNA